jgi:hypothetical protein
MFLVGFLVDAEIGESFVARDVVVFAQPAIFVVAISGTCASYA